MDDELAVRERHRPDDLQEEPDACLDRQAASVRVLMALALVEGGAWSGVSLPFLKDIEMQVRLLVAVPLLIIAELVVHRRMRPVVGQFIDRGLVPEAARDTFHHAVASAMRLRDSVWAELLLIAVVYVVGVGFVWRTQMAVDLPSWRGAPVNSVFQPSLAGWWLALVSLPVFQFLLLRWYFRLFIWARFLWQVSRIDLKFMPMHPDRCGGLGFLAGVSQALAPVLVAQGALLAGMIANRIFYAGASLPEFKVELIGLVAVMLSAVLGPLLVFSRQLETAKRVGLREHGTLAQRYVQEYDRQWLRGGAPLDEPLVGSADIQSLADLGNSFEVVKEMRWAPFTLATVFQLGVTTLVPVVPLMLTMISLEELLVKLLQVVSDVDCTGDETMTHAYTRSGFRRGVLALLAVAMTIACSGPQPAAPPVTTTPSSATPAAAAGGPNATDAPIPDTPSPFDALPESVRAAVDKPFTGDFAEMVKRRVIRVGVTFNRTHYFIDAGQERGLTYEALKSFETDLNTDLKTGNLKIHMALVPMSRGQLPQALSSGRIDMVAAMVTVRPELEKLALFSEPTRTNVSQVVVTGPGAPAITTADDLGGQAVFVRRASPYFETVTRLSDDLQKRGKPAITIDEAPDALEDDDVLEMVNAGLAPITVVDDYLANFWKQIFTDLTVRSDVALRTGGVLAVAFRKESPKLRDAVNTWIRKHGKGDAFRNVIERRYLQNVEYAKNAAAAGERRKLQDLVSLFKKYGSQYNLDYLLMAAQGYQESTLDHSVKSPVGAIGVMQVMPPTGKELNVGDINELEANIHAGVKYMRFMMDRYYKDEPMDPLNKGLMAFASYNAGPGRVRQLRREAAQRGLDPNVWFGNVERVASERIGRETVTYVSNIYKYYITYRLLMAQDERRAAAKAAVEKRK